MPLRKSLGWSGWRALYQDVMSLRHGEGRLMRLPKSTWLTIASGCIDRARLASDEHMREEEAGIVCALLHRQVISLDELQVHCEVSIEELEALASLNLYK